MCTRVDVLPSGAESWVVRDGQDDAIGRYRFKRHAIAFARAVAFSHHVELFVQERDGRVVRHPRHTLTYPKVLD